MKKWQQIAGIMMTATILASGIGFAGVPAFAATTKVKTAVHQQTKAKPHAGKATVNKKGKINTKTVKTVKTAKSKTVVNKKGKINTKTAKTVKTTKAKAAKNKKSKVTKK